MTAGDPTVTSLEDLTAPDPRAAALAKRQHQPGAELTARKARRLASVRSAKAQARFATQQRHQIIAALRSAPRPSRRVLILQERARQAAVRAEAGR
jgi:hypothetical protein